MLPFGAVQVSTDLEPAKNDWNFNFPQNSTNKNVDAQDSKKEKTLQRDTSMEEPLEKDSGNPWTSQIEEKRKITEQNSKSSVSDFYKMLKKAKKPTEAD